MIETPHEHDVLSGRGNFVNYHAGNEYFRALVQKHKLAYVACPKPQKGKFSQLIVDEIKSRDPPGRFLKQDADSKLWYDIGEKKALDKTRQALREGAPEIQKELGADAPQATNNNKSNNISSSNQSNSVGSTSPPSYQPQTPSCMPQIPQMPNTMNNFASNQFGSAALYSSGMRQQQQQQQQQFCDNSNNSNGGMNSNHFSQDAMLNNNNNNSMMMINFQQQQQQQQLLQQQQQNPMSLLTAQEQQLMMNLVIRQQAQQQQQQQQQQGQLMSAPALAGLSDLEGNRNTLNSNLVPNAPLPPKTSLSSYMEPRPFGSNIVRSSCVQEQEPKRPEEDEYIAPLRASPQKRMSPQKRISKLRKDDSSSSLRVDNIFSNADKNRSTTKFNNSGLSMSLSVNNIDNESDVDPDNLGRMFDSSLKLSHQSSVTSLSGKPPKSPSKRSLNVSNHDESMTQEKGMASVFQMSLNTIGDISEFGDSYATMNDEMSFANLFADGSGSEYR